MNTTSPTVSGLTIQDAQKFQPWVVPYSDGIKLAERNGVPHVMATHAVLHAIKSLGKIAAICEERDHDGDVMVSGEVETIANMSADLLTIALRYANLYKFDLAAKLVERVQDKNGVNLLKIIADSLVDPDAGKIVLSGKFMPIMMRHAKKEPIPWEMIEPHEKRAQINHGQSLERLKERGGLSPFEAVAIIRNVSWGEVKSMSPDEAVVELRAMVDTWTKNNVKEKT